MKMFTRACVALSAVLCAASFCATADARGMGGGAGMHAMHVGNVGHGHMGHGHIGHGHGHHGHGFFAPGFYGYDGYYDSYYDGDCYRIYRNGHYRTVCD